MPAPRSTRSVTFDEGIQETPIFWREDLPAGVAFAGPAVVEQFDATTLVPPGARAEVDAWLNIVITV